MNHHTFIKQSENQCVFCQPMQELVLESTPHFQLIFDPFALVPGHLLITSKNHYGCLGEVPRELQQECDDLRKRASDLLEESFEQPVFRYEHGRAGHCIANGVSSRSCHHYHEHLLPADISLQAVMEKRFKGIRVQDSEEICDLFDRYDEYLLVDEPSSGPLFYIASSDDVEPHLLRTLVSQQLLCPDRADWENYTSLDLFLEGREILLNSGNRKSVA